jgi:hypothetical protein
MSHHCIYFSKTLVMEEMEKVKNGEDLDSSVIRTIQTLGTT